MAENNGWTEQEMGERLNINQSSVSNLYRKERISVKKLIQVSKALKINLIAEVYLSRMYAMRTRSLLNECTITVGEREVRLENPKDAGFLMIFLRKDR